MSFESNNFFLIFRIMTENQSLTHCHSAILQNFLIETTRSSTISHDQLEQNLNNSNIHITTDDPAILEEESTLTKENTKELEVETINSNPLVTGNSHSTMLKEENTIVSRSATKNTRGSSTTSHKQYSNTSTDLGKTEKRCIKHMNLTHLVHGKKR